VKDTIYYERADDGFFICFDKQDIQNDV